MHVGHALDLNGILCCVLTMCIEPCNCTGDAKPPVCHKPAALHSSECARYVLWQALSPSIAAPDPRMISPAFQFCPWRIASLGCPLLFWGEILNVQAPGKLPAALGSPRSGKSQRRSSASKHLIGTQNIHSTALLSHQLITKYQTKKKGLSHPGSPWIIHDTN